MHPELLMIFSVMLSQASAYLNFPAATTVDSNTFCPTPEGISYDLYEDYGEFYQMCGLIKGGKACKNTPTIPFPVSEFVERGPIYTWVLDDSPSNRQIDSICSTHFPTGGDSYVAYNYVTFCDGTSKIATTIATDVGVGQSSRGDGEFSVTVRHFAFAGPNTIVSCEFRKFGESNGHEVSAATFGPINREEIHHIKHFFKSKCLAPDGLYVLPYKYPPKCVTEQMCLHNNHYTRREPHFYA